MIHGLVAGVETRIAPHVKDLIPFLISAIRLDNCDQCGCRNACGLISDIANSIGSLIIPHL